MDTFEPNVDFTGRKITALFALPLFAIAIHKGECPTDR